MKMKSTILFYTCTIFGLTAMLLSSCSKDEVVPQKNPENGSAPVSISVPGSLSVVAASYLTTVTHLTVTGTIDARDFKTMRDDMPLLEVVDLSGSTVSAYSGREGTNETVLTDYPANEIPIRAFESKTSLTTFIYPASVTSIGESAFESCSGLAGSLTIPSSVTSIGKSAYYCCIGFTGSLTIPSSVTSIGNYAFFGCIGFTGSLTIPTSVTTIGNYAFNYCSGLTGSLTIPSSVTTIGVFVFSNCSGFTGSLTIPASVTSIGNFAFDHCSGLAGSLTIPSSVATIGEYAFNGCSGFTGSLNVPSSVTAIGFFAFAGCSGFTGSLTIPSSVATIGDHAFSNCSGFTSIYSYATTPIYLSASENVFWGISETACILHVPFGSKVLYSKANQWQDFTNIVEDIPNSLNEVLSNAISIYPNPAISTITVSELSSVVSDKDIALSTTDVSGNSVLTKSIEPTLNSATIDVSSLSNGAYVMVIQSSNGKVVKRFLKR